jgi:hypothetical protein
VQSFYLLRDFYGGADGRVWLACHIEVKSNNVKVGTLAVIKFQRRISEGKSGDELQKVQEEVIRWHKLGITNVYHTLLTGRHAIVMPFAFHYTKVGKISSHWWVQDVIPPIKDFEIVYEMAVNQVPSDVLTNSINQCACQRLVHKDIEWRHVAMFPKYIIDHWELLHCFIDLGAMSETETKESAQAEMEESKQRLLAIFK